MKHITSSDIAQLVSMQEAIEAMRQAFRSISSGEAQMPQRMRMDLDNQSGSYLVMPSYLPYTNKVGLKLVSLYKNNEMQHLPMIHAVMIVTDAFNGRPLAVLDAEYLTALRTGAAAGLATDLLASTNAKVLAVFGTGGQAACQVAAIAAVRPLTQIRVFARNKDKAEKFCENINKQTGIPVSHTPSPEALQEADIICTATTAKEPVFEHRNLKPYAHINAIGSYKSDCREIPGETIARSFLVVDQREAALAEAGDIVIPIREGKINKNHIQAELGELVDEKININKKQHPYTVFKSVGLAVQDTAIAHLVIQKMESGMV